MSSDIEFGDNTGRSEATGRVNLLSIQLSLTRIDGKMDSLKQDVHYVREAQMTQSTANERRFNDQEMRIRAIEGKRYVETKTMWSVMPVLLGLCSVIVAIITLVVK